MLATTSMEGGLNGNDALIDGLGSDQMFGGNGDDFFFATQPQLLGWKRHGRRSFRRWRRATIHSWCRLDPIVLDGRASSTCRTTSMPGKAFTFAS